MSRPTSTSVGSRRQTSCLRCSPTFAAARRWPTAVGRATITDLAGNPLDVEELFGIETEVAADLDEADFEADLDVDGDLDDDLDEGVDDEADLDASTGDEADDAEDDAAGASEETARA